MRRPQVVTVHTAPEERLGVEIGAVALGLVVVAAAVAITGFSHAATVALSLLVLAGLVAAAGTLREAVLVEERDWPPTEALLLDLAALVAALAVALLIWLA